MINRPAIQRIEITKGNDSKRIRAVHDFNFSHRYLTTSAKGSSEKHQAWAGGYIDHIEQCLRIAATLYDAFSFEFSWESVYVVLFFHDIEKIFKYGQSYKLEDVYFDGDKWKYYTETLPEKYDIKFTDEELNALKYIHGEGDDYCEKRVMNELAGFCHSCDTISARCFHNLTEVRRLNNANGCA